MGNRVFIMIQNIILLMCIFACSFKGDQDIKSGQNRQRVISFSGYEWVVANSYQEKVGPGPNYFSDSKDNVWTDAEGNLHLKITHRNGVWYCAKLALKESYGFNKYVFYVSSRVDQLDKNVVGGLFTYLNDYQEIDIEFSKWNIDGNMDSQFAVQPTSHSGNKTRYYLNLNSNLSTHMFNWQKNKIEFASYKGHTLTRPVSKDIICEWTYTGSDIPPDSDEKLEINLWLFRGSPPSDNTEAEMIIKALEIY
jgi:hypothetical protein